MKWAVAQGYRDDNPAGDAISAALPKTAVRKLHMRALPRAEVGAALARVKGSGAYLGTMLAFEFLVLAAARSGEVRNARWEQIDRDGAGAAERQGGLGPDCAKPTAWRARGDCPHASPGPAMR